jgi:hypothetical protein
MDLKITVSTGPHQRSPATAQNLFVIVSRGLPHLYGIKDRGV